MGETKRTACHCAAEPANALVDSRHFIAWSAFDSPLLLVCRLLWRLLYILNQKILQEYCPYCSVIKLIVDWHKDVDKAVDASRYATEAGLV